MFSLVIVFLLTTEVFGQRRELEADITGIARSHLSVISDNPDETTEMTIVLMLTNIIDFDSARQLLDMDGWLSIAWTDSRYMWNPETYGNITQVSLPCRDFPKPDLKLFNSAEEGMIVDHDVNCAITNTGEIRWIPLVNIHSFCDIQDPTGDTFTCHLEFGSWTHPCKDLTIKKQGNMLSMAHFDPGWRWEVIDYADEVTEEVYSCCPGEAYCIADIMLKVLDKSRTPRTKLYYYGHSRQSH